MYRLSFINKNYMYDYNVYTINTNIFEKQFICSFDLNTKTGIHLQFVFNFNPLIDNSNSIIINSIFGKEITKRYPTFFQIKKPLNTFKTKKKLKICGALSISTKNWLYALHLLKNNFILMQKHIYYLFATNTIYTDTTFLINNLLDFSNIAMYYTLWSTILPKTQMVLQCNICNTYNHVDSFFFLSHHGIDIQ